MADETEPSLENPTKNGEGGGAKYAVIGLLLVFGAGGLWYFTKPRAEAAHAPEARAAAPAPAAPPPTQQFDDTLEIPEEVATPVEERTPVRTAAGPRPVNTDWSCSGDISQAEVRSTIAANQNQVRQCYERRLRFDPMLAGNLQVRMKVSAAGSVQAVSVGGTLHDADVVSCVRERVKQWRFPNPHGGQCAVIAAPFTLNPRQ